MTEPAIDALFSGTPISQDQRCGWQERQDALNQRPELPMPGPWNWEVHDHSMATLCGGGEDAIVGHIMSIAPCSACAERAEPKEWKWGRCMTPAPPEAALIAAAPAYKYVWHMLSDSLRDVVLKEAPEWVRQVLTPQERLKDGNNG